MPVQVEHRLAGAPAGIDDDTVIAQPLACCHFGDEVEHALVLVGAELCDVVEALYVMLGDDEQMRPGLRIDVADGDEALDGGDVVTLAVERAEEAVVRQRGSPPR
jgi:hypothetical protein